MIVCVADTGPCLHLAEIDQLALFRLFSLIAVPEAVANELRQYGLLREAFTRLGLTVEITRPAQHATERIVRACADLHLQDPDRAALALAVDRAIDLVLTDDLALREACHRFGKVPVGSIGILFRCQTAGLIAKPALEQSLRRLFDESTLHLSPVFRAYVLARLEALEE
jgi:predicted nucleic acid-binding protein